MFAFMLQFQHVPATTGTATVAFFLCLLAALKWAQTALFGAKHVPLPPGPRPLPLVGNLFQLPKKHISRHYASLSTLYGSMYYMNVLGRHFIVINSLDIVKDLFVKRSAHFSHRPRMVMATELVGRKTMLFMNYGPQFAKGRKLMSTLVSARTATQYHTLQEHESLKLVMHIRKSPGDAAELCRWKATSLVIRMLYGIEVKNQDDELVHLAEDFSALTTEVSEPGRWLVDSFPILRHLPSFLPGAHFKVWAQQAQKRFEKFDSVPYNMVKTSMASGNAVPCWVTEQLSSSSAPLSAKEEQDIRSAATSLYSGGSDTSSSVLITYILMMIRHPDVQRKAQAEVDLITGGCWIPGLNDRWVQGQEGRAQFPYVECLVKELLRFNPVVPLVPHSVLEDQVYGGYLIPKGTWVMANIWAFMHDEERYPDSEMFCPERFERGEGREPQADPIDFVFGFGRRACPGSNFGMASVWISIMHFLWAFNVLPGKDEQGNGTIPPAEFTDNHTSYPKPFPYRIQERSAERMALVELALQHE